MASACPTRLAAGDTSTSARAESIAGVRKAMKVLEGLGGHLFLSNDTNRSIDQYTGQFLVQAAELERWDAYLDALQSIRKQYRTKTVFLAAPSKETIFPEFYPYPPGKVTPMRQLAAKFARRRQKLVYPVEDLKACRELSYAKGDTHWTDYGGMLAAQAVLNAFGIAFDLAGSMPSFALRTVTGDLGSKTTPMLWYPSYFAEFAAAGMSTRFDNGIDNHGRIWIFERSGAMSGTVVLFGDSFSKNMAPWLSLVFKRLVYVHAAASIDLSIVESERPDFIVLQTNSRFVVNAPQISLSTKNVIGKKVAALGLAERDALATHVDEQPDEQYKAWMLELLATSQVI